MSNYGISIADDGTKILPVADFLDYISYVLQITEQVKVSGEISSINQHSSGVYMSLKDLERDALLECYISHYTYRGLGLILEQGMHVAISGMVNIYKPKGRLSFRVESVEPLGEGSLKRAYELLKQKLETEGLFGRKRELPECIKTIGIITSRTGAVIDDFRNNLTKRGYQVVLINTRVEGRQAEHMITSAINEFNRGHIKLDCLVLMRGGGSFEDLQAFNSEAVARALFASPVPTIAAIGHDRDVPLICLVADRFTSTPTAAAVLINQSWDNTTDQIYQLEHRIIGNFAEHMHQSQLSVHRIVSVVSSHIHELSALYSRLSSNLKNAANTLSGAIQTIRQRSTQIKQVVIQRCVQRLARVTESVATLERHLSQVNPERQLKLGYSITRNARGVIIREKNDVASEEVVDIQVSDGIIKAKTL